VPKTSKHRCFEKGKPAYCRKLKSRGGAKKKGADSTGHLTPVKSTKGEAGAGLAKKPNHVAGPGRETIWCAKAWKHGKG